MNLKSFIKEIKKEKLNEKCEMRLAYNKVGNYTGAVDKNALVPQEREIAKLIIDTGHNKPFGVDTSEELDNIITLIRSFDDFGKISYYNNRLDAYYKNGKKAMSIKVFTEDDYHELNKYYQERTCMER